MCGSAARLCSEGRWLEKYERSPPDDLHQADLEVFDQTSDLDASILFDVPDTVAWTRDILRTAGRGKWASVQVANHRVKERFGLGVFLFCLGSKAEAENNSIGTTSSAAVPRAIQYRMAI